MQIDLTLSIFFLAFVCYVYYQFGSLIKRTYRKMAELKLGFWLLQLSGFTVYGWALIITWGDAKSAILFILALIFASYKILNAHLDYSKKKIDFDEYKREAREKKKNLDNVKVNKEL